MRHLHEAAQAALDVQPACNAIAVIHSMNEAAKVLFEACPDTDSRNEHPILTLFLVQLCHLNGQFWDHEGYHVAIDQCKRLAALRPPLSYGDLAPNIQMNQAFEEYFNSCVAHAKSQGCYVQFFDTLERLRNMSRAAPLLLGKDWAPFSFSFRISNPANGSELHGGMIYGDTGGNGKPGWSIHT